MLNKYVDVFYGNGEIDLPKPEGIASTWFFIKAQCGNTYPHACTPFNIMSVGTYTGAYPTGYGNHMPNGCGPVPKFDAPVLGFSHMHQTGTGGIGAYYNYAVTSVVSKNIKPMTDAILSENATPGYYSVKLKSGIFAEFTVNEFCAVHRYTVPEKSTLYIDFSANGLKRTFGNVYYLAKDALIKKEDDCSFSASIILQGIKTHFYVTVNDAEDSFLWKNYEKETGEILSVNETEERYGGAFTVKDNCVLKVAVSFKSVEEAKEHLNNTKNFEETKSDAEKLWGEALSKIEIDADDDIKEQFYSNFYHSLLKPAEVEDGKITDFATLWDIYKTQLPLIYTLFKEKSQKIVKTLLDLGEKYVKIPTGIMLWDNVHRFDDQAQSLAVYTLADAYYRNLVSGEEVIKQALNENEGDPEEVIKILWEKERYTHILDLTEACAAAENISREIGDSKNEKIFRKTAEKWITVFDKKTGMLKESTKYYEGNSHNYSFRLLNKMEERIAIFENNDAFMAVADDFFGYNCEPVKQCNIPNDAKGIAELDLRRFDGINNEHDIEAPYVYNYIGRNDRVCEIVRNVQKYMFTKGRGGLPGNNDSGALTAWYVWNALGLFPVTGQDKMIISYPLVKSAKVNLSSGKVLKITVEGEGDYVKEAFFNGEKLENFCLSVRQMIEGGELKIIKN